MIKSDNENDYQKQSEKGAAYALGSGCGENAANEPVKSMSFGVFSLGLLALSAFAGWMDWRRGNREDLDRVGWVNWPLVMMLALIGAAMSGLLAFGL